MKCAVLTSTCLLLGAQALRISIAKVNIARAPYIKSLYGFRTVLDQHHLTSTHPTVYPNSNNNVKTLGDDDNKYKIYKPEEYFSKIKDAVHDLTKAFKHYKKDDEKKAEDINNSLTQLEDLFGYARNTSLARFPVTDNKDREDLVNGLHDLYNDSRDLFDEVVGKKNESSEDYKNELKGRFEGLVEGGGEVEKWLNAIMGFGGVAGVDIWEGVMETLRSVEGVLGGWKIAVKGSARKGKRRMGGNAVEITVRIE